MKRGRGFDEVMIVNPCDPAGDDEAKGAKLMQLHYAGRPGFGYYADPYGQYGDPYGDYAGAYGYADPYTGYADPYAGSADPYAGYAYAGYGDPYAGYADPYGYYAQADPGWGQGGFYGYGDDEQVGYYAQEDPFDGYGAYADDLPDGYGYGYGYGYGDGYGTEDDPAVAGWYGEGEQDFAAEEGGAGYDGYSGFVREGPSPFNAGCPMPTNVAGPDTDDSMGGYVPPPNVNANCGGFRTRPGGAPGVPDTFRPLW